MKSDMQPPPTHTHTKSFQSCPLLPQTKIQIQIFLFSLPSVFVCRVLVPLSCSGKLKEELFTKSPVWECAHAPLWVRALLHPLQPVTCASFTAPCLIFSATADEH